MTNENILIGAALIATIIATFGNTTNTNGRLNIRGWIIIIVAIIVSIFSFFKTKEDDRKSDKLALDLNNARDTIRLISGHLDTAAYRIGSEYRRLWYDQMKLSDYDMEPIKYCLVPGMDVRITKQNCDNVLYFVHNDKERVIAESPNEIIVQIKESSPGGSFFSNKGDSPCGVDFEIWGTLNMIGTEEEKMKFASNNKPQSAVKSESHDNAPSVAELPNNDITEGESINTNPTQKTKGQQVSNDLPPTKVREKTMLLDNEKPSFDCKCFKGKIGNFWGLQLFSDIDCRTTTEKKVECENVIGTKLFQFQSKKDNRYHVTYGRFTEKQDALNAKADLISKFSGKAKGIFPVFYSDHQ